MHKSIIWTQAADTAIMAMRAQNLSWDHIAAKVGATRHAVSERGLRIGAAAPLLRHSCSRHDSERPPLPAGSLATWGAINAGTCIDGAAYPLPTVAAPAVAA